MRPSQLRFFSGIHKLRIASQKGMALPVVLSFSLIFALEIAGLSEYASLSMRQIRSQETYLKEFFIAEAATEKGVARIRQYVQATGQVPATESALNALAVAPSVGSNFTYNNMSGTNTFSASYNGTTLQTRVLTAGDYAGLNGSVRTITISVAARSLQGFGTAPVILTQTMEIQLIPIFQFGIFYQNDLEIIPGADMTFAGPVHTNGDIYVAADGSSNSVNFQSQISSASDIFHGRKDSTRDMTGDVTVQDTSSVDQSMRNADSTWLDSDDPDWLLESQSRWGNGTVLSSVHGTRTLNLPLPTGSQPQVLIDRRSVSDSAQLQTQKMDYKANLRIIDGVAMNQAGSTVELRYCSGGSPFTGSCPLGETVINPISSSTFYNGREGKTIQSTNIDMSLMQSSPNFQTMTASSSGVIIYSSDRRNQGSTTRQDALRIINGSSLPANGLTVASENPVYIKGNYNTVNKRASAIIGDSCNILSGSWNDANSTLALSSRGASNTTINTAIIAGNTETTTGNYNGGFENIMRFLESWSGDTLTYSGSVTVLYNSRIATGAWGAAVAYYNPPTRVWGFDTDLGNPGYSIPGFPSVYAVVKSSYEVT